MKRLLTTSAIAIALGLGIYLYACPGDDDFRDYFRSIFSPEIAVNNSAYQPLFFDQGYLFYQNEHIGSEARNFRSYDEADWKEYLDKALSEAAISYFLYDENALPDITKYNAAKNKNTVKFSQHTPKTISPKLTNFFALLGIARGNEHITNTSFDPWNYEESSKKERTQNTDIQKAEKMYQNAVSVGDSFFANRMWLQVLRLKFYSTNRSAVINFFNETHSAQPKNSIYYRGLHYLAGAYYAQKDYAKSNAALATLFAMPYGTKQAIAYDYHPLLDNEVEKIASSLSPEEQCALWAMQGFYVNEAVSIQKILAINPQSPHLDFLLGRYINRIETKANSYELKTIKDYRQLRQKVVTVDFQTDWLLKAAKRNNYTTNRYLWTLAAGYLETYHNHYQEAKKLLQEAESLATAPAEKIQVRLISLFNEVTALNQITANDEKRLLKEFQWLKKELDNDSYSNSGNLRSPYVMSFSKAYLSVLYRDKGDSLMNELLAPGNSYFRNQQQADAMEQFLLKKNKTEWEKYWADQYLYTLGDIYESRAIYAYYSDDLDKAISEMKRIPFREQETYQNGQKTTIKVRLSDTKLPANPFNGFIMDCNDCQHSKKQRTPYTKLTFLEKMKEMEEKIAKGEDVYNNALLVANAFYNSSYFGSIRAFYYNNVIGEFGSLGVQDENKDFLLNMDMAKKYYLLAQKHATNDEQRAKIAYMLAKVERNEFYNQTYFYQNKWDGALWGGKAFKDWQGFKELRKYPHTKYYKEVINECGYFYSLTN